MKIVMTTSTGLLEGSQSDAPLPASARREETAVYVGRAFFRMTRPAEDATDGATDAATDAGPAVAALPIVGLVGETEEHVVLSPPSVTVIVAENRDAGDLAGAVALADAEALVNAGGLAETGAFASVAGIENEGPSGAVLVPMEIRSASRRSPMWLVAAALVVGAFGTLSAQAVMRRSPKTSLTAVTTATVAPPTIAPPPAATAAPTTIAPPTTTVAPTAPTAVASTTLDHNPSGENALNPTAGPLVVEDTAQLVAPSTVTAWNTKARINPEPRRTNRIQVPITSAERTFHTRAVRPLNNTHRTTTWIDPFASIKTTKVTTKTSTKIGTKTPKKVAAKPEPNVDGSPVQKTGWVDPFAD